MAALTAQKVDYAGKVNATYSAVGGSGDTIANPDGKRWARIKNGNAGTVTVTVATPATYRGRAVADDSISIPTGQEAEVGFWDPDLYNDSNGNVTVVCSPTSSVTIAAYYHP